jgi:hypothetical protein
MIRIDRCNPDCPGADACEYHEHCMCGTRMEGHGIGSGHSPVSMHDYHCEEITSHEELVAHGR